MTPPPPPAATAAPPAPVPGPGAARITRPRASLWADRAFATITFLACVVGIAVVVYLIVKTVEQTGEVWSTFGVWGFITGTEWIPTPVERPPAVRGAAVHLRHPHDRADRDGPRRARGDRGGAGHHRPAPAALPRPGGEDGRPAGRRAVGRLRPLGHHRARAVPEARPGLARRDLRRPQHPGMATLRGTGHRPAPTWSPAWCCRSWCCPSSRPSPARSWRRCRASSRRPPTPSAPPAGRWCGTRCSRGPARASSERPRSGWGGPWARPSRSRCCWATRRGSSTPCSGPAPPSRASSRSRPARRADCSSPR